MRQSTPIETVHAVRNLALMVGQTPIAGKESSGFADNRILVPMVNGAIFVLQKGVTAAGDIDIGMAMGAHQPVGPLALADLIGLDTFLMV